jgi:S1-C subfamily serine protease
MTGPDETAGDAGARPTRRRAVFAAVAVVALVLIAIGFYRWGSTGSRAATPRPVPSSAAPSKDPSTAEIFDALAPSVVSIEAAPAGGGTVDTGTGVIVNANATILTAFHVVKSADLIKVTFADGSTSAASVAAADPAIDIATLSPDTLPSVVVPAVLGRPDRLNVGDNVIAIGNQLGLTRTTTTGVVSGLDRRATNDDGANLAGLIQFDAAVNPGSSGGPLVDGKGETVGIVVALANPTAARTFIGVGFAVPIGVAVAAGGGDQAPQQ